MESLQFYASYYYSLGMNVAPIYAKSEEDDFKAPQKDIFEKWRNARQDVEDVMAIDWQSASGLGLITGVNNLRVIDIDGLRNADIFSNIYKPNLDFLPKLLEILGLPQDYQWVINSGSQEGLHIVVDVDDIPNVNNNVFSVASHEISHGTDILWRLFSVLPPSKHKSGNRYSFFFDNKLPQYKPHKVSIDRLYKMLLKYSGRCGSKGFTLNENIEFKLYYESCQVSKTCSVDGKEYLCQASIERCPELLERTTDGLNKLGIDCVLTDFNKTIDCFNRCDNDYAKLNLTIFKSLGLIESTFEEVCLNVSKLKFNDGVKFAINDLEDYQSAADELFETILEHASKYCKKPNRLLFFDTETSALPQNHDVPSRFLNNWPRLVQIAWIVADTAGNVFERKQFVIKPDGFEISKEAVAVHGITHDFAIEKGTDIKSVLTEFVNDLNDCHAVVCHNADFDKRVVGAEMYRYGFGDFMDELPSYCTMKLSTNYCKNPSQYAYKSYKYPKLSELYRTLFDEDFQDAHDAAADINATLKCYFELVNRGVIEKCKKDETLGTARDRLTNKNWKKKEEAWQGCTTVKACENYLATFPFGAYSEEAKERIDDLSFDSCKSIPDYDKYIKKFNTGRHLEEAESKMFQLCQTEYDFNQYLRFRPNGKYLTEAKNALDDLFWKKQRFYWGLMNYAKKYPNGRHLGEANENIVEGHVILTIFSAILSTIILCLSNGSNGVYRFSNFEGVLAVLFTVIILNVLYYLMAKVVHYFQNI